MKKLTLLNILICSNILCLELIHAQVPVTNQPGLPIRTMPTIDPHDQSSAKYAEYQSYCRQNDFDENLILTDDQKKRRITLLEEKLKKNPTNQLIIISIIKEYLLHKDTKTAESFYLKNRDSLSPDDAMTWSAEFDVQKKLTTNATTKLEKYITENPKSVPAVIKLAQIKKIMGFYSEAADLYLDLQSQNKKSDYSTELCEIYALDSHHTDAEKMCSLAIRRQQKNPLPDIYMGISFRERELFKEAQKHFENSIVKKSTEFGLTCLGELFYLNKDKKKSREYLNLAVEKNKFSHRAQLGLALAEFEDKKYDQALIHFKQACVLGHKDTLEMRKCYKILEEQKSTFAPAYYDEIQNCRR